jgi:hypothetical protein
MTTSKASMRKARSELVRLRIGNMAKAVLVTCSRSAPIQQPAHAWPVTC